MAEEKMSILQKWYLFVSIATPIALCGAAIFFHFTVTRPLATIDSMMGEITAEKGKWDLEQSKTPILGISPFVSTVYAVDPKAVQYPSLTVLLENLGDCTIIIGSIDITVEEARPNKEVELLINASMDSSTGPTPAAPKPVTQQGIQYTTPAMAKDVPTPIQTDTPADPLDAIEARVEALRVQIEALRVQIEALEAKPETIEAEAIDAELEAIDAELEALRAKLEALRTETEKPGSILPIGSRDLDWNQIVSLTKSRSASYELRSKQQRIVSFNYILRMDFKPKWYRFLITISPCKDDNTWKSRTVSVLIPGGQFPNISSIYRVECKSYRPLSSESPCTQQMFSVPPIPFSEMHPKDD